MDIKLWLSDPADLTFFSIQVFFVAYRNTKFVNSSSSYEKCPIVTGVVDADPVPYLDPHLFLDLYLDPD
jgi:hypothetical protein